MIEVGDLEGKVKHKVSITRLSNSAISAQPTSVILLLGLSQSWELFYQERLIPLPVHVGKGPLHNPAKTHN